MCLKSITAAGFYLPQEIINRNPLLEIRDSKYINSEINSTITGIYRALHVPTSLILLSLCVSGTGPYPTLFFYEDDFDII